MKIQLTKPMKLRNVKFKPGGNINIKLKRSNANVSTTAPQGGGSESRPSQESK